MIATLIQDSKRYENETATRRRQFGQSGRYGQEVHVTRSPNASPGLSYGSSTTFHDPERMGRPDVPRPGYAGYSMDTTVDDHDEERPLPRGYRVQEPRMDTKIDTRQDPRMDTRLDPRTDTRLDPRMDTRLDPRMDTRLDPRMDTRLDPRMDTRLDPRTDTRQDPRQDLRQDPRQDPGQQPTANWHTQMPSVYQAYSRDPAYPSSYLVQPVSSGPYGEATQPRTLGPNNTPPPSIAKGDEPICPADYPSKQE